MPSGSNTTPSKPRSLHFLWFCRYILFHHKRHSKEIGIEEMNAFLTHLAIEEKVSAPTQNQALSSLLFLYREVSVSAH
ncbi:MAG: site-specific integrase [Cyanobacteriota bacterium]|nr:site-specific integrase [Cyanobacteriota bacterium]